MPYMQDYQPLANLLQERIILVTGASCGIGRSVALACAAHGACVILLGPSQRTLEPVYDAIEAAGYPTPAIYVLNLEQASAEVYMGLANSIAQEFGHLDGLLHNAAVLPFLSRIDDYDIEAWNQVLQVNLTSPFLLTQACLPLLRSAPDASIILTSDTVGRHGKAYWGAYAVAKFGLEGLMQVLADELAGTSSIRINSLDPGPARTAMRMQIYPGQDPSIWPLPEQLVNPYLYLLGPESKHVTGQALSIQ